MIKRGKFLVALACMLAFLPGLQELPAWGQTQGDLSTGNRRARRAYERAEEALRRRDHYGALEQLRSAISRDEEFVEAYLLKGDIHMSLEQYGEAISPLRKAMECDPGFFPAASFYLGKAFYLTGRYHDAVTALEGFLEAGASGDALLQRGEDYLERSLFARESAENPVPFDPVNPGPAINSRHSEYSPALTADEQTLVFTRKKPREGATGHARHFEDFYISHFRDGAWTPAKNLGPPLNTPGNEGAQTITADGRHLYFAACNRPDGVGSCDIYYARRTGDHWSRPVNPGPPLNSSSWDSQPSVSADGNTLFFASGRPGSRGPMDIWMATRNEDGQWSTPENLGPVINTDGNELSPFIHHDNKTLYFASDGHPGMGGLDLFVSRRDDDGRWSEPKNLGYPINTHGDEFALVVGASGEWAWFASDKEGGYGGSDLYTFALYPEVQPHPHTFMRGTVVDDDTGDALEARFSLIDLRDGETITESYADPVDGSFLVSIPIGRELALNVSREGYLFFSEHFSYRDVRGDASPYLRNIRLKPVAEGKPVVLRNVFFETDSDALQETSYPELGKLLRFMRDNPGIHVVIGGHTDNTGTFEHNLDLSRRRAESVRSFLVGKGIEGHRISTRGYADTRPVDTNETSEGRANNRRTEFMVEVPE